jgi:hypothetical protein
VVRFITHTHTHTSIRGMSHNYFLFSVVLYIGSRYLHACIHEIHVSDEWVGGTRVTTTRGEEKNTKLISAMGVVSCNTLIAPHTTATGVPNKKVSDFRGHCCATRIRVNLKFSKCQWVFSLPTALSANFKPIEPKVNALCRVKVNTDID